MMRKEIEPQLHHNVPQLALSDFHDHPLTDSSHSSTLRSGKFVPAEFKKKHMPDSHTKLPRPHKNSAEFLLQLQKKSALKPPITHFGSQKSIQ